MNEKFDNLEAELHRMRLPALSADLVARVGAAMKGDSPSPWAPRRLLGAIWAGSLAACVIVTMLLTQNESAVMPSLPLNGASNIANADGPILALALVDPKWIDSVK